MIDQYGRTIDYLRLSVTDLCNYRCQYCMPADGVEKGPHGAVLSVEECGEIARAAVKLGVQKIRLTGGEPLVRRGILDICQTLRAIPELKELCLTTNGSLLPELAKPLREAGIRTQLHCEQKKFKAKMSYADKLAIPYVIFLGEDEINAGVVACKDMKSGEQTKLNTQETIDRIKAGLAELEKGSVIVE